MCYSKNLQDKSAMTHLREIYFYFCKLQSIKPLEFEGFKKPKAKIKPWQKIKK